MNYNKPYLTIPEQRQLLEQRGMVIPNADKADEYLRRIGYYRLSAYWYPFRKLVIPENNEEPDKKLEPFLGNDFKESTTFKNATDLYAFDKGLRLLVLDAIERIEISIRTELALALGAIDPYSHRSANNFSTKFSELRDGKSSYLTWLSKLDEKAANSKEEFAEHFRTKYAGENVPIWIAVELLDFGPLSIAFSNLRHPEQQQIVDSYDGINFRLLRSWVRTLSYIRNICAHHARLWNRPLVSQPAIPRQREGIPTLSHLNNAPETNKRIYASLATMRFMLTKINPRTKWADRLKGHISTFPEDAPNISLQDAGFPLNWEDLPLWN